ncbi:hypothetical protein GBA52_003938 [Prunus armeniaca]|nr:hypothetical protein GBA52_003938 [Prunus armeniaca]
MACWEKLNDNNGSKIFTKKHPSNRFYHVVFSAKFAKVEPPQNFEDKNLISLLFQYWR